MIGEAERRVKFPIADGRWLVGINGPFCFPRRFPWMKWFSDTEKKPQECTGWHDSHTTVLRCGNMLTIIINLTVRYSVAPSSSCPVPLPSCRRCGPDRSEDPGECGDTIGGVSLEGCFRFVSIEGWGGWITDDLGATVGDMSEGMRNVPRVLETFHSRLGLSP